MNNTVETAVPIYVYIGTKAQAIKMAPVVRECRGRGLSCTMVNTGQHGTLTDQFIREFGLPAPELSLTTGAARGVDTLTSGLRWLASMLRRHIIASPVGSGRLFRRKGGIGLVHGDTASTLLTVLIAKRAGQKVAHVEAGLRSWRWFHPFPEELVRILTMSLSDHLFVPNEDAYGNLERMRIAGRAHRLPANTSLDAIIHDIKKRMKVPADVPPKYALATIHRMETLYDRRSMESLLEVLEEANRVASVVFIQHPPTLKRLTHYGLQKRLLVTGIQQMPLLDHATFVNLIRNSRFIITDGGSVQEEAHYLGVPCLLYRDVTERSEGIGENVILAGRRNREQIREFLSDYDAYRRPDKLNTTKSPSAVLVEELLKILPSLGACVHQQQPT